ncbi:MAG: hypothetical protein ACFE9N_05055 [Promethearchaeota archaeon]
MIQELMIIDQAGIALFYHSFVNNDRLNDEQTLASYFDIICRFTKREFNESLKMLTLDNYIFYFYTHKSNFHLVLKCVNTDIDRKILESFSETIINSFLYKYKNILENFNGEISVFKSFSNHVTQILESEFKDYQKALSVEH